MKRFLFLFISFVAAHCFAQENVTFQRVDEAPANGDWSGEYLIVHENNPASGQVLRGSNQFSVSSIQEISSASENISNKSITTSRNANNTVVISKLAYDNYTVRTKAGFYLGNGSSNKFQVQETLPNPSTKFEFTINCTYSSTYNYNVASLSFDGRYIGYNSNFKNVATNDNDIALYRATSYSRSGLTAGKMGTICLPSDATITGAKIYSILGTVMKEGNLDGLVLEEQTTAVAGTPYIFIAEEETMTATYSGAAKSDPEVATGLVGNLNSATANVPTGCYVISNNQLRKVNGGTATIATHRAYLDLSEVPEYNDKPAKSVYWGADGVIIDDATAIENISTDVEVDECIYNINGIRVQEGDLAPGVYIKGKRTGSGIIGKKYVIK